MDIADLQQRVALLPGLLATQRDTIERLLFQLAFNEQPQFVIAANTGTGKSTLLMALAELFSAQCNVAMLRSDVSEQEVNAQLMQQWFALPAMPEQPLAKQVEGAATASSPLLLLVDDAERFTTAKMQELATLPAICICFSKPDSALAGTYLTLPAVSLQDAAQLLQHETLNSIELAERHARANGNIHLLLLPLPQHAAAVRNKPGHFPGAYYPIAAVILVLLFSAVGYGVWQSQTEVTAAVPVNIAAEPDVALGDAPAMALPTQAKSNQTDNAIVRNTETAVELTDSTTAEVITEGNSESNPSAMALNERSPSLLAEAPALVQDDSTNAEQTLATDASTLIPETKSMPEDIAAVDRDLPKKLETENVSQAVGEEPQPVLSFAYDEAELLALDKQQFALQLTVLTNDRAVQRFSRTHAALSLKRYQRNWQGQMQIIVLLAPYTSAAEAKRAIAGLPATLKNAGPFVKSLQAIQAEIRARELSQNSGAAQ